MEISRRGLIIGGASAIGFLAAPAIVRASSLMPIAAWDLFAEIVKPLETRIIARVRGRYDEATGKYELIEWQDLATGEWKPMESRLTW